MLLLADPTRGVDIATKQEIYRIIRAEADKGVAVLILSTELTELLGLCDRVLVMVDGSIAAEFDSDGLTEEDGHERRCRSRAGARSDGRQRSARRDRDAGAHVVAASVDVSTIAAYGLLVVTVGTYLALDPGTMTLDRATRCWPSDSRSCSSPSARRSW